MVRVSALHEQHAAQGIKEGPASLTPGQQLAEIGVEVRKLLAEATDLLAETLLPELEANAIQMRRWQDLDDDACQHDLREPEHTQVTPTLFATGTDIFSTIARGDLMVHLPYESFTPVLDFLDQASTDPDVLAIKMTLYRTGSNPSLVRSLIRAADSGKQVAVCVEIKARLDEVADVG